MKIIYLVNFLMLVFLPQWWQTWVPYTYMKNIFMGCPIIVSVWVNSWFCCGHWFHLMSSLSCTALATMWLWVNFLWWIMCDREFLDLIFAVFFSFLFVDAFTISDKYLTQIFYTYNDEYMLCVYYWKIFVLFIHIVISYKTS